MTAATCTIILLVFTSLGVISVESQGKMCCDCAVVHRYVQVFFQVATHMYLPSTYAPLKSLSFVVLCSLCTVNLSLSYRNITGIDCHCISLRRYRQDYT